MTYVSPRSIRYLTLFERAGLVDVEDLLEGLPITGVELLATDARLHWDTYVQIAERMYRAIGDPKKMKIAEQIFEAELFRNIPPELVDNSLLSMLRHFVTVLTPQQYPHIRFALRGQEPFSVITIEIPPPFRASRTWLMLCQNYLEVLCRMFGLQGNPELQTLHDRCLKVHLPPASVLADHKLEREQIDQRLLAALPEREETHTMVERMATLGTLSAGVAHELKNPLAFVIGNLELALGELSEPSPNLTKLRQMLEESRDGALRMQKTVQNLQAFSRSPSVEREPVSLQSVITTAIRLAGNELRHKVVLDVILPREPLCGLGDEHQLTQVCTNLLLNAAQASEPGSRLKVRANQLEESVEFLIEDEGKGIPPEMLERVFDPFYTTKPETGTGLGLAICRQIIERLDGELLLQSQPDVGTTARVRLPTAHAASDELDDTNAPAALQAPRRPQMRGPLPTPVPHASPDTGEHLIMETSEPEEPKTRRRRILVIDDEPLMRNLIERSLRVHDVHLEASAMAGLEWIGSTSEAPDLILCDLMMPDHDGAAFYAMVQAQAPELVERIVFMSGGAFTPEARAFIERIDNQLLEKPFSMTTLRELAQALPVSAG